MPQLAFLFHRKGFGRITSRILFTESQISVCSETMCALDLENTSSGSRYKCNEDDLVDLEDWTSGENPTIDLEGYVRGTSTLGSSDSCDTSALTPWYK